LRPYFSPLAVIVQNHRPFAATLFFRASPRSTSKIRGRAELGLYLRLNTASNPSSTSWRLVRSIVATLLVSVFCATPSPTGGRVRWLPRRAAFPSGADRVGMDRAPSPHVRAATTATSAVALARGGPTLSNVWARLRNAAVGALSGRHYIGRCPTELLHHRRDDAGDLDRRQLFEQPRQRKPNDLKPIPDSSRHGYDVEVGVKLQSRRTTGQAARVQILSGERRGLYPSARM
jgi:hypothetical protein